MLTSPLRAYLMFGFNCDFSVRAPHRAASDYGAVTPSTVNSRQVEFWRRCGRIFWYSGDLYQRSKLAASGNSRITIRLGSGPPSMSLMVPPAVLLNGILDCDRIRLQSRLVADFELRKH